MIRFFIFMMASLAVLACSTPEVVTPPVNLATAEAGSPITSPQVGGSPPSTPNSTATFAPPTEAPAVTGSTEAALLARAQEENKAFGNWLAHYKYKSPRYSDVCKSGDYVISGGIGMLFLRAFSGVAENAKIEARLDKVVITGDGAGRVFGSFLVDGEVMEFSEKEGERWTFHDGQWWSDPEDWQDGCPEVDLSMGSQTIEPTPVPLSSYSLGEAITIDAGRLTTLLGEPELTGHIVVTVREHESTGEIEDQFLSQGMIESKGRFVILYYAVMNNLNSRMQVATQINDRWYLTDDRERRWDTADYTGGYFGISGSAAVAKGYEQPATWVSPGFKNVTAAVFDVPSDAQNLLLVWEKAGVKVSLIP